jgi:hypothetical protein
MSGEYVAAIAGDSVYIWTIDQLKKYCAAPLFAKDLGALVDYNGINTRYTSYGLSFGNSPDHALCIFRKGSRLHGGHSDRCDIAIISLDKLADDHGMSNFEAQPMRLIAGSSSGFAELSFARKGYIANQCYLLTFQRYLALVDAHEYTSGIRVIDLSTSGKKYHAKDVIFLDAATKPQLCPFSGRIVYQKFPNIEVVDCVP